MPVHESTPLSRAHHGLQTWPLWTTIPTDTLRTHVHSDLITDHAHLLPNTNKHKYGYQSLLTK